MMSSDEPDLSSLSRLKGGGREEGMGGESEGGREGGRESVGEGSGGESEGVREGGGREGRRE